MKKNGFIKFLIICGIIAAATIAAIAVISKFKCKLKSADECDDEEEIVDDEEECSGSCSECSLCDGEDEEASDAE